MYTKVKKIVRSLVGFLLLFILWEVIAKSGRVSWVALPPIEDCFKAFIQASVGGRIFMDIASSLYRVFIGLAIGFSIGGTIGIIIGWFTKIQDLFEPVLMIIRPIPPLAWVGLALVWLGLGNPPAIFIIAITSFWYTFINTLAGIKSVDKLFIDVALTCGASEIQLLRKVSIPAALPYILTGLRSSIGAAWAVTLAAEMVAVKSGIGYFILLYTEVMRTDMVITGIAVIGLLGLLMDYCYKNVEKHLLKWRIP